MQRHSDAGLVRWVCCRFLCAFVSSTVCSFFLQDAQKGEIGSVFFWGGALLLLVTLLRVCMRVCVSVRVYVCVRECVAMYT